MRTIAGCSHMEGKDPRGPWEQPPVIRTSERFGHVRTTDCYSHVQGSDPGVDVRATAHDTAPPRGPCANNRRLFTHERVGDVRTTDGHSHMQRSDPRRMRTTAGYSHKGRTCANDHRSFAHARARLRGTCANNRWLLAHEDSQPLAFCTCKGRTYALYVRTAVGYSDMQGAGPKVIGTCKGPTQESSSQLFGRTLLGATWSPDGKGPCSNNRSGRTEGAMCEQPPVIRMRQGRTHGGHVRTTTGYMQRSDARGPCVNKAIRIWNSVTCMWSLSSGLQGSMCEQPPAIRT